ncbi:MAG: reverse transcriptase domain-containing protein [Aeromonas sp.]
MKTGIPQGDPLSMLLFCVALEPVLDRLSKEGLEVVSYADDIVVGSDAKPDLKKITSIFEEFGL